MPFRNPSCQWFRQRSRQHLLSDHRWTEKGIDLYVRHYGRIQAEAGRPNATTLSEIPLQPTLPDTSPHLVGGNSQPHQAGLRTNLLHAALQVDPGRGISSLDGE